MYLLFEKLILLKLMFDFSNQTVRERAFYVTANTPLRFEITIEIMPRKRSIKWVNMRETLEFQIKTIFLVVNIEGASELNLSLCLNLLYL